MRRIISASLLRSVTAYWLGLSCPRGSICSGMISVSLLQTISYRGSPCAPSGEQVPVRKGILLLQVNHGLLIQSIIVLCGTADFVYKWTARLERVHRILVKVLTCHCSRRAFELMGLRLHLLAAAF